MQTQLYPPYSYLEQVLDICPRAGSLYLLFWKDKNEKNRVCYYKQEITENHYIPWKRFKTDLSHLQKIKVLKFCFNDEGDKVTITLKETPENILEIE